MVNRNNRESKADATHLAAMRIVEAERAKSQAKTDRLRAERLAKQAESAPGATASPKK